ncbi:MAG: 2-amino-4-hydroxy-6-hydroxymethyldihydropteridine diphosphokinase [Pseudomonadota bacterium]
MAETHTAFIALGANLGEPARQIESAFAALDGLEGTRLTARSALYVSHPEGYPEQPDYLNAVARIDTRLGPRPLLGRLLDIEQSHGRERTFRNAPRTLDLDILLFDALEVDECGLHIPHPRMHERAFVLIPLAELAPELVIPGQGPLMRLVETLPTDRVRRLI